MVAFNLDTDTDAVSALFARNSTMVFCQMSKLFIIEQKIRTLINPLKTQDLEYNHLRFISFFCQDCLDFSSSFCLAIEVFHIRNISKFLHRTLEESPNCQPTLTSGSLLSVAR